MRASNGRLRTCTAANDGTAPRRPTASLHTAALPATAAAAATAAATAAAPQAWREGVAAEPQILKADANARRHALRTHQRGAAGVRESASVSNRVKQASQPASQPASEEVRK